MADIIEFRFPESLLDTAYIKNLKNMLGLSIIEVKEKVGNNEVLFERTIDSGFPKELDIFDILESIDSGDTPYQLTHVSGNGGRIEVTTNEIRALIRWPISGIPCPENQDS